MLNVKIFSIPKFEDQEKQRRANMLVATQFASVVMIVSIMTISFILAPEHPEVIIQGFVGSAVILISYLFLRQGKLEAAGWMIAILGWLILTLDLVFISGIRGVNVLGQILIVMFAGLAISGRAALIMTVVSVGTNFIILQLELNGILAQPVPLQANLTRWFIQTTYTALAAVYIWRADSGIKDALLKSQTIADRYRALFERTNDGVVIFDLNWIVLSANAQAVEMLGYSEAEIVGLNALEFGDPENLEEMNRIREKILEGQTPPTFEETLVRKNGTKVPVELNMALVYADKGNPCHVQCVIRDIAERKDYELQLEQQALFDPLTNLPNRILFEERYQSIHSKTDQGLVAVLFVDLDNFKGVNDEYGHAVGDQVLQELSRRMQGTLRESDTVARMGGDEFVIILQNIRNKMDVSKITEKLLNNIYLPIQLGEHSIQITASVGISIAEKRDLPDLDLLKNSDVAMYQAKDSGKNNFKFFHSEELA